MKVGYSDTIVINIPMYGILNCPNIYDNEGHEFKSINVVSIHVMWLKYLAHTRTLNLIYMSNG